jgi:hypothetical protein
MLPDNFLTAKKGTSMAKNGMVYTSTLVITARSVLAARAVAGSFSKVG